MCAHNNSFRQFKNFEVERETNAGVIAISIMAVISIKIRAKTNMVEIYPIGFCLRKFGVFCCARTLEKDFDISNESVDVTRRHGIETSDCSPNMDKAIKTPVFPTELTSVEIENDSIKPFVKTTAGIKT